jgi:chorismate mutase
MMKQLRGIRGATTVTHNTESDILKETQILFQQMIDANNLNEDDVPSIIFSSTADLTAVHPAKAARMLGWTTTALMGMQEIEIDGMLPRCIRILVHWHTDTPPQDVRHIYLNEAVSLRPDRV